FHRFRHWLEFGSPHRVSDERCAGLGTEPPAIQHQVVPHGVLPVVVEYRAKAPAAHPVELANILTGIFGVHWLLRSNLFNSIFQRRNDKYLEDMRNSRQQLLSGTAIIDEITVCSDFTHRCL